jgi:hypothetical protein
LHDRFHALKSGVKIYVKLPWRYSRIEVLSSDLERYPNGKMDRDVEVLVDINCDEKTVIEKKNLLIAFPNQDPHVFQALLTVKERSNEDDYEPVQSNLDLRCILQRDKDGSLCEARLEWTLLGNANGSTAESHKTQTDETANEGSGSTGLSSNDLISWAQGKLEEVKNVPTFWGDELIAEEDIGYGAIARATLTRGSQDGIFGAMEHLRLRIFFSLKKENM